ncbi:hypothetical protein HW555_006999 [Spodoptera exigua]|uniref:Uncharacterized protein n=1 Tax=Spodoptera exigua TaxID=7107 RepID=A0A835GDY5_SPOEX|nr:hypothetical protein HW555_006999 [Spodoptera exigua]
MKFFVVFLSVLVVVLGQGEEDGVYAVEVGNVEVVGDVQPQIVYAEESPAVRVFDPAEQLNVGSLQKSVYAVDDQPIDRQFVPPSSLYIPLIMRACTNAACANICNLLGFKKGVCISTTTCQCSN